MIRHKCNDEETRLINKIVELDEELKRLRSQLLGIVKDRVYIWDDDHIVRFHPEITYKKIDRNYLKEYFPDVYDKCSLYDVTRSEYITINKNYNKKK